MVLRWDLFSIFAIDELITEWIYETNKKKNSRHSIVKLLFITQKWNKNI